MATLSEIRAKLLAQEKQKTSQGGGDNGIFPHWNSPDNETSVVRFLPDGDSKNDFFWRERQMINLEFSGIKGQSESKPVTIKVPCVEMWEGQKCPIHEEIRPWFKDSNMEDLARKYWKKKSYLFQGLVVSTPIVEEEVPANPVRRFIISTQIYKIIQQALMDPDFGDQLPTDYDQGVDFRITKTKKGQYADYTTSNWARKTRSLDQAERDALTEHGLFNLSDFMPKQPSEAELKIIFEMFESSVDGELYDPERFSEYYRPWGMDAPTSGASDRAAPASTRANNSQQAKTTTTVVDDVEDQDDEVDGVSTAATQPVVVPPASSGGKDAKDILAAIRARKTASN
jgi:hypothetical protein